MTLPTRLRFASRMMMWLVLSALLCGGNGLICGGLVGAAETPLGRSSTDRLGDLIAACLEAGLLDDAQRICQRNLEGAAPGSVERARWAIRLSSVGVARLRAGSQQQAELWDAAREPLREVLAGYEDQPAAPWLELQSQLVGLAHAEMRLMLAMSNPANRELRDGFEAELREANRGLRALDQRLDDLIPLAPGLQRDAEVRGVAHRDDLMLLQRTVRRRLAEAMLLRTQLYEAGSTDGVAAATEALRAAQELADSLPSNSPQRDAVLCMLARAKRLAGEPDEAAAMLRGSVNSGEASSKTVAEWLRAEMDRGNWDLVRRWMRQFYGTDGNVLVAAIGQRPAALELDLARLQYLLSELARATERGTVADDVATNRESGNTVAVRVGQQQVTDWVKAIAERHGSYAQRRAEALMLRGLRASPEQANPTLLMAQADQLVRAGDRAALERAAELYRQASELAGAQQDEANAFRAGARAGACWLKAGKAEEAAEQFARAARGAAAQPGAGDLHYQGIVVLAQELGRLQKNTGNRDESGAGADPTNAQQTAADARRAGVERVLGRLQELCVAHLITWPRSESAVRVRELALPIFTAVGRTTTAALISLQLPDDTVVWGDAVRGAGVLLRRSLAQVSVGNERAKLAQTLYELLEPLVTGEDAMVAAGGDWGAATEVPELALTLRVQDKAAQQRLREELGLLAALGLSGERLRGVWIEAPETVRVGDDSPAGFAYDLRRVRIDGLAPTTLALDPPTTEDQAAIVMLAMERLWADGMLEESMRPLCGQAMLRVSEGVVEPSVATEKRRWELLRARGLAWAGQWKAARDLYQRLAAGPPRDGEALREGAKTLAGLSERAAVEAAILMWNRLAAGLPQGSSQWHEVKIATAEAMRAAGQVEEARRLVRYILLTAPPEDAGIKARYQELAEPPR